MSENVPTFGRENLETEAEKREWDYWSAIYERDWVEPEPSAAAHP